LYAIFNKLTQPGLLIEFYAELGFPAKNKGIKTKSFVFIKLRYRNRIRGRYFRKSGSRVNLHQVMTTCSDNTQSLVGAPDQSAPTELIYHLFLAFLDTGHAYGVPFVNLPAFDSVPIMNRVAVNFLYPGP
jgi:hypothetical protein